MKLIAIDLDGTLLSPEIKITEENIQALRKAQSQGHIVMICSGRAPQDIGQIVKKAGISCPVAGSNGTVVQAEGEILKCISIKKEDMEQIARKLDEGRVPYRLYTNQAIYVPNSWSQRVAEVMESGKVQVDDPTSVEFRRMTEQPRRLDLIEFFDDYRELLGMEGLTIQKFFILTLDMDQKAELLSFLAQLAGIAVTSSGPFNIEVMNREGHKGNGLKIMAEHYGVPMEDTVAIGDNFNDVPMLEVAGLSIAMGNADPEVKEMCDIVTLSNAENGVAHAIERYVLEPGEGGKGG